MKTPHSLLFVLLVYLTACGTTKEQVKKNMFSFSYEGNDCKITSVNTASGEGSNYLSIMDENKKEILTATDLNQDGTIDQILQGEYSLEVADLVYKHGISIAQNSGNYQERQPSRTFESSVEEITLTVSSYLIDKDTPNNRLMITNRVTGAESILLDLDANGILDRTEKGELEMEIAQKYYTWLLSKAKQEHRVVIKDGIYLITTNKMPLPS